ncbi:hypothetical protein BDR22DRAFT_821073 [Usnea florida]
MCRSSKAGALNTIDAKLPEQLQQCLSDARPWALAKDRDDIRAHFDIPIVSILAQFSSIMKIPLSDAQLDEELATFHDLKRHLEALISRQSGTPKGNFEDLVETNTIQLSKKDKLASTAPPFTFTQAFPALECRTFNGTDISKHQSIGMRSCIEEVKERMQKLRHPQDSEAHQYCQMVHSYTTKDTDRGTCTDYASPSQVFLFDNWTNSKRFGILPGRISAIGALFNSSLAVIVGWGLNKSMDLNFEIFNIVVLIMAIIVVGNFLRDQKSNYLEGALCILIYIIIDNQVESIIQPNQCASDFNEKNIMRDAPAARRAVDYTSGAYHAVPQALMDLDKENQHSHKCYRRTVIEDGDINHASVR